MTARTDRSCPHACLVGALGGLLVAAASFGACTIKQHEPHYRAVVTTLPTTGGGGAGAAGGSLGGGGTAGSGGAGAQGGAGGCLDSAEHAAVFAIERDELCLVGKYDAAVEVGFFVSPTWGRHGGPLTASYEPAPADQAALTRWQVPAGATGTLAPQTLHVPLGIAASPVFFGAQAVDLPFEDWTLVSWTGNFGGTDGEALLLSGGAVAQRRAVVGWFAAVGLGDAGDDGRVLHTSLTELGQPFAAQVPALYAADFCVGPVLCGVSTVAAWGEASGPVATDQDSNVFVFQTAFSTGDQTLRAFAATTVAPGAAATAGDELFTVSGFGSELAALSPDHASPGLVLFQPFNPSTFEALDVVAQPYAVADDTVAIAGDPSMALSLVTANTAVTLMTDDSSRLWVGVATGAGQSTFYVLGRRP